ncbi:MAG: ThiF family adenylyltransferase [Mycobacteriales bacterium]
MGKPGQLRLLAARVLVIGAGGLGSPVALYLAAAGVGTIGISDFDTVDVSNLQRQIVHNETRVGIAKTDSARATLNALNSEVRVRTHPEPLNSENCAELFADYDIIVNGCDNFATRYLANDVAIFGGKPLVDGSVNRFTGEVTVVVPGTSACYRCRYPEPPDPTDAPSCSEAGVFGVLPGIIGSIQAVETIKLILNQGTSLAGRLLRLEALTMTFTEYSVPRDPACPVCGDAPSIIGPVDYVGFCAGVTT